MTPALCAECAEPIGPADETATLEQVDACTAVVERVTYHAACWARRTPAPSAARQSGR